MSVCVPTPSEKNDVGKIKTIFDGKIILVREKERENIQNVCRCVLKERKRKKSPGIGFFPVWKPPPFFFFSR